MGRVVACPNAGNLRRSLDVLCPQMDWLPHTFVRALDGFATCFVVGRLWWNLLRSGCDIRVSVIPLATLTRERDVGALSHCDSLILAKA